MFNDIYFPCLKKHQSQSEPYTVGSNLNGDMVNGFVQHFSSLDDHSKHFTVQFYIHTHIHTVHLLAALCCSMRHNSGFSILLKDISACRFLFGKTGDRTADLQVGGRPLYSISLSRSRKTSDRKTVINGIKKKCEDLHIMQE